jgi:hypothetical protein
MFDKENPYDLSPDSDKKIHDLMKTRSMMAPQESMAPAMVADEAIPQGAGAKALQDPTMASQAQTNQASSLSNIGGAATTAGMASANPYLAGAGLTLQAIGMVDNAKRQQEQAKIDAYNKKIMAMRSASRNLFA